MLSTAGVIAIILNLPDNSLLSVIQPAYMFRKSISGIVILNILFTSVVFSQTQGDLPPQILKLLPEGTELISRNFTSSPTIAVAEFVAEKKIAIDRTVEYHLLIRAFDNSSPTWKMRSMAYRKQMDDRIGKSRSGLAPESADPALITVDPVTETKYGWGSALTQRLLNHPPNASEYVTYDCAYFGMTGGIVFELYVHNIPDNPGAANKWAKDVADVVARLTISNIGN